MAVSGKLITAEWTVLLSFLPGVTVTQTSPVPRPVFTLTRAPPSCFSWV